VRATLRNTINRCIIRAVAETNRAVAVAEANRAVPANPSQIQRRRSNADSAGNADNAEPGER
jgi:hypothetical protein